MSMRFYNRQIELQTIREWVRLSARRMQVGVVYGRRRIGKTRLVKEAVGRHPFLYFFVERKPLTDLLQDFQEEIGTYTDRYAGTRPENLGAFLDMIGRLATEKSLVVVFDEFQNFRYIDPAVFGTFQKWIDANQDRVGLTVIFVGSMFSLMKKIFTEYKEPLYGRLTGQIFLKPLDPLTEAVILSDLNLYTPENWLRFHTIFGGVPRYYDLLSDRADTVDTPMDAVQSLIVSPYAVLKEEGRALLMEEFGKKYMVYFSILQAVSRGSTTRTQIANATGLNYNRLGPYLDELEKHYELIERQTPVLSRKERSKTSCYRIIDPFTRFWFRYLFKYGRYIEIEAYDALMAIISRDLPVLEGVVFEELITRLLVFLNRQGKWVFPFDEIGRYWDRMNREIDLVAVNRREKTILFAECKLNAKRITPGLWKALEKKSRPILKKHKDFDPVYGVFVVAGMPPGENSEQNVWTLESLRRMAAGAGETVFTAKGAKKKHKEGYKNLAFLGVLE